jgi:hypothetical protein
VMIFRLQSLLQDSGHLLLVFHNQDLHSENLPSQKRAG